HSRRLLSSIYSSKDYVLRKLGRSVDDSSIDLDPDQVALGSADDLRGRLIVGNGFDPGQGSEPGGLEGRSSKKNSGDSGCRVRSDSAYRNGVSLHGLGSSVALYPGF